MEKSFDEWVEFYERKTKMKFKREKAYRLFYFPERGFAEIAVNEEKKMLVIRQLAGDGAFWHRAIEILAILFGVKTCGSIVVRHIKPYIRYFGYKIDSVEYTKDGYPRYFCTNSSGSKATVSPWGLDDETKQMLYIVTWEVKDDGAKL